MAICRKLQRFVIELLGIAGQVAVAAQQRYFVCQQGSRVQISCRPLRPRMCLDKRLQPRSKLLSQLVVVQVRIRHAFEIGEQRRLAWGKPLTTVVDHIPKPLVYIRQTRIEISGRIVDQ